MNYRRSPCSKDDFLNLQRQHRRPPTNLSLLSPSETSRALLLLGENIYTSQPTGVSVNSLAHSAAVTATLVRLRGKAVFYKVPLLMLTHSFLGEDILQNRTQNPGSQFPDGLCPSGRCAQPLTAGTAGGSYLGQCLFPRGCILAHLCGSTFHQREAVHHGTSPGPGQMVGA